GVRARDPAEKCPEPGRVRSTVQVAWCATPERQQRLDMKGLRKNVEEMKGRNLIGPRSSRPACQGAQVARQRGWIAGEISDAGGSDLHQARERRARNACSGRVEHGEIRSFFPPAKQ